MKVHFEDRKTTIGHCSCQPTAISEVINHVKFNTMHMPYGGVGRTDGCIHLDLMTTYPLSSYLPSLKIMNDPLSHTESSFYFEMNHQSYGIVNNNNGWGMLRVAANTVYCMSCRAARCGHIRRWKTRSIRLIQYITNTRF